MKLSPKFISVFAAILFALLLVACSKTSEEPIFAEKNIFQMKNFHLELPQKYIVKEDTIKSSLGRYFIYRVRDSVDNEIMSFQIDYVGEFFSLFSIPFKSTLNPDEFGEIGRRDTVRIIDGEKIKERTVLVWARYFPSKKKDEWRATRDVYDVTIYFIYHPDQVDTSICENIIRSAKIHSYNKDYLCNIYKAGENSPNGEKMFKLRNQPLSDYLTLIKNFELEPINNQDLFEKRGNFLFLADCFLDNEYKGSFHINESCEIGWNGKYAEKEDVVDLLEAMKDEPFKEKLMKKCRVEPPSELPRICSKLYKLNIHYSKNNVPQAFDFTYHSRSKYLEDEFVISPIQAAIDYDGFVQLRVDGKIREFPISYVNPGEEKKLDESKIKIVKSLLGKTESTTVSDLWGTGSLFTRSNLFKGKWQEMRILTPLLSDFQGMHVSGYACSDWQPLREVTEPKCKGQTAKPKVAKSKAPERLPADSLMKRIIRDIDAVLDCAEEEF